MTEQYQQEEINLAGRTSGGGGNVFVFRPGVAPSEPNVFDTWEEALAAAQAVAGMRVIQVDDSVQSPAVVPAGTHDMSGITLAGTVPNFNLTGILTVLEVDDGGTLDNLFEITDTLEVVSNSFSPLIEASPASLQSVILINRGSTLRSTTGVAAYNVPAGAFVSPVLNLGGQLGVDAISIDGGSVGLVCQDLCTVDSAAIVGAAGSLFFQLTGKGLSVDPVQTGFMGFVGGDFDSAGGAMLSFSCGTLATPGSSFLYPGGSNPAGASVASPTPQGFQMMRGGFLGGASVVHQVVAAPNPITYDILVNGVPALTVFSDASFPTSLAPSGAFTRLVAGDLITAVGVTAGAPTPTDIRLAIQIV